MSVYRPKNSRYYLFDFEWQGHRFHGSTKQTNRYHAELAEKQERQLARHIAELDGQSAAEQPVTPVHRRQKEVRQPDSLASPPSDTLRTPKYAAARLGCSPKMLTAYVRTGTIRYIEVGQGVKRPRRMFTDAYLDEFIAHQTKRATPLSQPIGTAVTRSIRTIRSR